MFVIQILMENEFLFLPLLQPWQVEEGLKTASEDLPYEAAIMGQSKVVEDEVIELVDNIAFYEVNRAAYYSSLLFWFRRMLCILLKAE